MELKKATFARQAWGAVRLALIWAKKGGAFARAERKKLRANNRFYSNRVQYLERWFSIDETPAFSFKMHRPSPLRWVPSCVNPSVNDFDVYENERDFFKWDKEKDGGFKEVEGECVEVDESDKDVDLKAEEFIKRFHEEMKMQRQISFLKYNEMIERSI